MFLFSESFFEGIVDFSALDQTVESSVRRAAAHPTTLYLFFHRYIYFNGYASTVISRLASSLGLSRYLFNDPTQLVVEEADRGMEIAANVLAAAADEGANGGVCHRSLAQLTLSALGDYAGLSTDARNQFSPVPDWLNQIVQAVVEQYQAIPNDRVALIRALGFHAASELLGDRENALIDRVVRVENRGIGFDHHMHHCTKKRMINGHAYHPWAYILIHGKHNGSGVEAEHFEYALNALNLCVQYQNVEVDQIQAWVSEGFRSFVFLQQHLFRCIEQECIDLLQPSIAVMGKRERQAIAALEA
jgi:hypothetical protein